MGRLLFVNHRPLAALEEMDEGLSMDFYDDGLDKPNQAPRKTQIPRERIFC